MFPQEAVIDSLNVKDPSMNNASNKLSRNSDDQVSINADIDLKKITDNFIKNKKKFQ